MEWPMAALCGILAVISLILSVRAFMEKGFLLNNAYLWASKQERETMNKKPHYRQTAIVFALLFALFLCLALETVMETGWLRIGAGFLCATLVGYAVRSSWKLR